VDAIVGVGLKPILIKPDCHVEKLSKVRLVTRWPLLIDKKTDIDHGDSALTAEYQSHGTYEF
jgi:hypothetical protein